MLLENADEKSGLATATVFKTYLKPDHFTSIFSYFATRTEIVEDYKSQGHSIVKSFNDHPSDRVTM